MLASFILKYSQKIYLILIASWSNQLDTNEVSCFPVLWQGTLVNLKGDMPYFLAVQKSSMDTINNAMAHKTHYYYF